MKEIHLLGKKIIPDKSPLLLKYAPSANWLDYWTPKSAAYCTILKVKDSAIRKIYWEKLVQKYTPEF